MTITDTTININDVDYYRVEKTEEEKAEEKTNYNNFMNFMTDIIVKYGFNVNVQ